MTRTVSTVPTVLLLAGFAGCATYDRQGLDSEQARQMEQAMEQRPFSPSPELTRKILALDPLRVTGRDVQEVLSTSPAPRIINIHGGIYPVHRVMISFS